VANGFMERELSVGDRGSGVLLAAAGWRNTGAQS
jgi:hypothetical protein